MDKDQKHIPFAVIVAATNGDEAAIQEILDFYDGYISKLSLRKLYDEYGNVYMVVDSELKGRIQAAVMDMIANFIQLSKSYRLYLPVYENPLPR